MRSAQRGMGMRSILLALVAVAAAAGLWLSSDSGKSARKEAQIASVGLIGEAAIESLAGTVEGDGSTHGSAVDMIRLPVEVHEISPNIHYASGVGNTFMISTAEGNVVFDTGLVLQSARQLKLLREQVSDAPVTHVIVSHSHADHIGGARLWLDDGVELIAHQQFEEEQRYLTELEPYFYGRNRTLFPWMPEEPVDLPLLRYGGLQPTITVDDAEVYRFSLGGVDFEVHGAAGAEGADNIVLWLPQQGVLLSGDFFGPQFPQFPNIFTMRGEKVRKPIEYVASLDRLMALEPKVVAPSHLAPTAGAAEIRAAMQRMRDAVQYVHDATVAGMNAGKSVHTLMREIELPPELSLVQNHGKVSWAVKSIWEYYATWFHFESTTELYPVPVSEVYADLAAAAGQPALLSLARSYLADEHAVKALHMIEVSLAAAPDDAEALGLRLDALAQLLLAAQQGLRNDYEIYWLEARIADTDARLRAAVQGQ